MTSAGHSLFGASIAICAMRHEQSREEKWTLLFVFALAANIPDLPIGGWGHDRYSVSHSVFVNLLGIGLVGILLNAMNIPWRRFGGRRSLAFGSIAWLSHLVLDSLYNHGRGIAIFWPISDARLALPVPWFSTVAGIPAPLDMRTLNVVLIEFLSFTPILIAVILWRRWNRSRAKECNLSREFSRTYRGSDV